LEAKAVLKNKKLSTSIALLSAFGINQANAASYEFESFSVEWDTVFTAGVQYRIEDRIDFISEGSSGANGDLDNLATIIDNAFILNSNDGNNNFDVGFTSQRTSILSEADFKFGDWGIFVRGKYWHDFRYGGETDATPEAYASNNANPLFGDNGGHNANLGEFNPAAKDYSESGSTLLDFFWYGNISIGDEKEMTLRIGRQVISWGEALLSGGGLSTSINHVDAHIRNQPGLELKELFLPSGAIFAQIPINDTFSMEAYYQYEWNPVFLDPSSTYFSEFDSIGPGGNTFLFVTGLESRILGVELLPENNGGVTGAEYAAAENGDLTAYNQLSPGQQQISRLLNWLPQSCPPEADKNHKCRILVPYKLREDKPGQGGQFGLALNTFLEDGSELGLFFVNYHEKIPNWILPIDALVTFAPVIDKVIAFADPVAYKEVFTDQGRVFSNVSDLGSDLTARQLNALISFLNALPKEDGTIGSITKDLVENPQKVFSITSPLHNPATTDPLLTDLIKALALTGADFFLKQYGFSTSTPVRSINYRLEWASNVRMLGASYSTVLGDANVAAEFTYRDNTPVLTGDVPRTPQEVRLMNLQLNTLMVFEPQELWGIPLWDFSSMVIELMTWQIPGKLEYDANDVQNPDRLAVQNSPQGLGASIFWSLEHQNVFTGWDIMIPIYMNWGIDGSQFNAGYRDGQVISATGITFKHLSGIEVGAGITTFWGDQDDIFQMLTQDRDNVTFTFKYGF
jgi:hypothetical protein